MQIAALYIRVSTDDQTEYSPDAQKRLLLDYAKKNNLTVSNEYVFIEEGLSGTKADKRPQFQKMIGMAKTKEKPFDVILVWKFSRFARNQEESIVYKSLLRKNNIDVISVSEPLADGPFGSLIERIIEWMDEYYSIRLSEEVKRGMTEKALRGEIQAAAPFGYYIENNMLYPNGETAPIVRKIFNMFLYEGEGCFSIAQKLNEMQVKTNRGNKFETRTVKYILQNPIYKGYVRWNPKEKLDLREQKNHSSKYIIKKGKHEPIISEKEWDEVNKKILREYRPKYSKPSSTLSHWLSGVLKCDNCGSTLATGGSTGGFQCGGYSKGRCDISHFVKYDKIEKVVICALEELAENGNFTYEIRQVELAKDTKEIIIDNLEKLKIKEQRIKDAYINGIDNIDEYKENKSRLEKERIKLESQISDNKKIKRNKGTDKEIITKLNSVCSIIRSDADVSTKNTAIRSVVEKIVYDKRNEHIDVHLFL